MQCSGLAICNLCNLYNLCNLQFVPDQTQLQLILAAAALPHFYPIICKVFDADAFTFLFVKLYIPRKYSSTFVLHPRQVVVHGMAAVFRRLVNTAHQIMTLLSKWGHFENIQRDIHRNKRSNKKSVSAELAVCQSR